MRRIRSSIVRTIARRLEPLNLFSNSQKRYEMSVYGVYLRSRRNDLTFNYALQGHYGEFISSILKGVNVETVFLDVGANIGLYSLLADLNPLIKVVHSFEPDPVTFLYLQDNVNRSLSKKIHLHNAAIGPIDQDTKLYQRYGHSGGATLLPFRRHFNGITKRIKMINEIRLNDLLYKNDCPLLVKIDVEGFELEVFRALLKTEFFRDISQFIIEFDVKYGTIGELNNLLEAYSFREIRRSSQGDHWDAYWVKN